MSDSAFTTEVVAYPGVATATAFRIAGHVRYTGAPELRREVLDALATADRPTLVIELGQVDEMDTAGAAVLVEAVLAGREHGRQVLLCSPSESVMRIFRLAGFEEALGASCPTADETRRRLAG